MQDPGNKSDWQQYREQKRIIPTLAFIFNGLGTVGTWGALITLFAYPCVRESFDAAHSGTDPVLWIVLMSIAASLFFIAPIIIGLVDVLVVSKLERYARDMSKHLPRDVTIDQYMKKCEDVKGWLLGFVFSLVFIALVAASIMGYTGYQIAKNAENDALGIFWTYIIGVSLCVVGHLILLAFYSYSHWSTARHCNKSIMDAQKLMNTYISKATETNYQNIPSRSEYQNIQLGGNEKAGLLDTNASTRYRSVFGNGVKFA